MLTSEYSSVFRGLFRSKSGSSSISDDEKRTESNHVIHLDGVTILEFESVFTFFYEGCDSVHCCTALAQLCVFIIHISDLFSFLLSSWQESFSMSIAKWVALAITHRFRFTNRVRYKDLVRHPEPLFEREIANFGRDGCASRCGEGEILHESSRMLASEKWLKRAAYDIVKQLWPIEEVLISA